MNVCFQATLRSVRGLAPAGIAIVFICTCVLIYCFVGVRSTLALSCVCGPEPWFAPPQHISRRGEDTEVD